MSCFSDEIIIHEMIHIGIEENFIKKYNLSHWEKEELVDLICCKFLNEIIPKYEKQNTGIKTLNVFINNDIVQENLPNAIEDYVKQNPR